jgi:hypothetical protein
MQEFHTLPFLKLSQRHQLPECSGIYFAIARDQVFYIGQAVNLRSRWQNNHHRLPQLEAINQRCEVKLFWLGCSQSELNDLERQYIDHYCPTLNQTKVPARKLVPSSQMLALSVKKLNERLLGIGICPANNQRLKTVVLGYLAAHTETRLATITLRKSLKAVTRQPDSLFRWTEIVRGASSAFWRTRCNGIEVLIIPFFGERLMHNPSVYEVMIEKQFKSQSSIPMPEYEAMRQAVKIMQFKDRLELARGSEIGRKLFPLECGATFQSLHNVEILCLTKQQLEDLCTERPYLRELYPGMQVIESDPVPILSF